MYHVCVVIVHVIMLFEFMSYTYRPHCEFGYDVIHVCVYSYHVIGSLSFISLYLQFKSAFGAVLLNCGRPEHVCVCRCLCR